MDYRELLKKYMAHVIDIQGVDFVTIGRNKSAVVLNPDEREELARLSEEAEVDAVRARTEPGQERP